MKKSFVLIVALLLLLTACQPTPEVDAVRQKNQGDMIDMAKAVPQTADTAREPVSVRLEAETPDFHTLYDIPEHLTRELSGADGRLVVHIDADVKVPDKAMPIVRVHPIDFSQAFVSIDKGYMIEAARERGFAVVINPAPEKGMSSSVRLGTAYICQTGAYDGILYAVADQPHLKAGTVEQLVKAFEKEPDCILAPESNGKRGNPVLFPASLFEELLNVTGDRGGRQVIAAHPDLLRTIAVPSEELQDIDTKEDMQSC